MFKNENYLSLLRTIREFISYLHNKMKDRHGILTFHAQRARDGVQRAAKVDGRDALIVRGGHQHRHFLAYLWIQGFHRDSAIDSQNSD